MALIIYGSPNSRTIRTLWTAEALGHGRRARPCGATALCTDRDHRRMTTLPRAILLDLDDTILEAGQRPLILLAVAETFADELAPVSPADLGARLEAALEAFWSDATRHRQARFGIAEARRRVIGEAFAAHGAPHLTPALADRFAERFTDWREQATALFPTARETIETLKARGVRLALITNGASATQRAKIERFDLAPLFDHIQIEGEVGFGKPEERAYLHALAALDARPDDTWMVGDNLEWEVAAPQRLGVHAI
jgi:putative hydrolase of the HAD superfamily